MVRMAGIIARPEGPLEVANSLFRLRRVSIVVI
jgi:hypothetical protein